MKPIPSPLNIIDFAILNFELNFVPPNDDNELKNDLREYFDNYELDIDFNINSNDITKVFIKTLINRTDIKQPGYSIYAEVACLFNFNKEILISPEAKNSIEGFSTIYIALNSLRGFISQITANGPLGRYILPSIDLNDLIAKKKAEIADGDENDDVKLVKKKKNLSKKASK